MQNNKKTLLLLLAIFFICSSCNKGPSLPLTNNQGNTELLEKLKLYNTTLSETYHSETKSPNWKNIAKVAVADIAGAGTGAKTGGKIGGKIGAFLGSPIYGAATGALVGGIAFGAFMSYLEYEDYSGILERTDSNFECLYSSMIRVASRTLEERMCNSDSTNSTSPIIDSTFIFSGALIPAEQVALPREYEDLELVGIGHNYALEMALEPEFCEIDTVESAVLPNVDIEILCSQEIKDKLREAYWGTFREELSISDAIIDVYLEAYCIVSEEDVIVVANDYANIISESQSLSDEEKQAVYSALSVSVNTTYYWSNRL